MTNKKAAKRSEACGYSLAELVIVLACGTILLVVGVPSVVGMQKEWTLWGSARILEASLQWGRMHAIASNAPTIFEVDAAQQKFYWTDALTGDCYSNSVRRLPPGIRITSAPKRPLRFYQHGNAVPAGTYTVAGDAGSYSVVVAPGGRIRLQRN